jgi:photosynthetic reaction center cytochrome c subunit
MLPVARTNKRILFCCLAMAAAYVLGNEPAEGQASPQPKPVMVEDIFKDVRVLRAISVNEFMATMGFFSASLGTSCTHCHVDESGGNWARYADDTANKKMARGMIAMVSAINKSYFGGRRVLTCYSCHRGGERPLVTPSLAELYSTPPTPEPDQLLPGGQNTKSADQILDRYLQALGGEQKLSALMSFVAKGVFQSYGNPQKSPVEVFFRAPNQRAMIVHNAEGDSTSTFDGRAGWIAAPATDRPVTLTALSGDDLDGARLDAELSSPARIKQALRQWRVGSSDSIDDREVDVLQGTSDGRYPVNLYFDSQTGLLARLVRYADSPVGLSPTQIDYADYHEIAGIKMPFRWTVTWLDGRSIIQLSDVRPNVPIDAATFARPAHAAPATSRQ